LRESTFEAFDAIIDLCMNEEVDALLAADINQVLVSLVILL